MVEEQKFEPLNNELPLAKDNKKILYFYIFIFLYFETMKKFSY